MVLEWYGRQRPMARVLHIEDDPRNRLLVRKLLLAEGHEVVDAADGVEGVRLALAERPDLVLVDINIPGLDGYEVTLRLRTEPSLARVPIIAITAEGDRETSLAVGCDGFLQKPIDARKFAEEVGRYLKGFRPSMVSFSDATGERLRMQSGRIVAHLEQKVAELSAANDRLRDMERLRIEFYRNVSHELATPLTPIVGYLRMLIDEELGDVNKPQAKALRAMDDSVRRLRGVLDNLVDVTALETGNMRFFNRDYDFVDTVRRAIAHYADKVDDRKITLLEELPKGGLPGHSDTDRLGRAIGQILENAVKFSPDGGIVGVSVRVHPSVYEVIVADTGEGIPEDRAARIFDAFYQVDGSATRAFGGVGVGLAIARRVARGLGGDVKLLPQGATIEGMFLGGAAFSLTVAKRAPSAVAVSP
jgi:signal transduction histidine kinase